MKKKHGKEKPKLGSLFAGIAGLDLGFERAGFQTAWQVEINPLNRAVLSDRFPNARQFEDVRHCGAKNLGQVDCIAAGFPCQDISNAGMRRGHRPGLAGERSGLFFQVLRILDELRPEWVVLENVAALLHSNDSRDLETVIRSLDERGYGVVWRVLDAAHFGSPARRRRVFLVGHLGGLPPESLLFDAAPVEAIPSAFGTGQGFRTALSWPGHTLQATNSSSRISIGSELLVAEENGWHQMAERERAVEDHGLPAGLDPRDWHAIYGAGNCIAVQVAAWIAEKIIAEMSRRHGHSRPA